MSVGQPRRAPGSRAPSEPSLSPPFLSPGGRVFGTVGFVTRPKRLPDADVNAFLEAQEGWTLVVEGGVPALVRTFAFPDFKGALGYTVELGLEAERRDHHPDVTVGWGKARVLLTTHDAGGLTVLDLELARAADELASRRR